MLTACGRDEQDNLPEQPEGANMLVSVFGSTEDNLPEEYAILNLSFFLTNPGSETVTDKFIHYPFTSADASIYNRKQIRLPLAGTLPVNKDIHVIANCNDVNALRNIATVADLRSLQTPKLLPNRTIGTSEGLPMYGYQGNASLNTDSDLPVSIELIRLCAKIRVTLAFTSSGWIGTDNRFSMQNVASYASFMPQVFPGDEPAVTSYPRIPLQKDNLLEFRGTTYIYESSQLPYLQIFTVLGGKEKVYTARDNFPLPVRNHLYDIRVEVYPPSQTRTIGKEEIVQDWHITVQTGEW